MQPHGKVFANSSTMPESTFRSCYNMNVNTKDDEIDYAFQMARDLGVGAMSCSTTVAVAKRVAAFADKYKIMWGGHGHANIFRPRGVRQA